MSSTRYGPKVGSAPSENCSPAVRDATSNLRTPLAPSSATHSVPPSLDIASFLGSLPMKIDAPAAPATASIGVTLFPDRPADEGTLAKIVSEPAAAARSFVVSVTCRNSPGPGVGIGVGEGVGVGDGVGVESGIGSRLDTNVV